MTTSDPGEDHPNPDQRTPRAPRLMAWLLSMGAPGLWALAAAAVGVSLTGLEPNLVEEGLVVHFAQRVAAGEHLYRDMVFFSGPLPFELLAVLFRIFGEDLWVGRAVMVALQAAATGLSYATARRSGLGPLAHAVAAALCAAPILLFPFLSMYFYSTISLYLGILAVYAALRGVGSARWAFLAGVLAACTALCKQSSGAVFALSLVAAVVAGAAAERRIALGRAIVLGGLVTALLTLGYYTARGDLADLFRCLVVLPLSLEEVFGAPYMNLWPPGELGPEIRPNRVLYLPSVFFLPFGIFTGTSWRVVLFTQFLYALPLLVLAATALARLAGPVRSAVWLNGALLLALTTSLFPRTDWGHLVFVLPTAVVQGLLLMGGRGVLRLDAHRLLPWGLCTGLVLVLAGASGWCGQQIHRHIAPSFWGPKVPQRPVSYSNRTVTIPRVIFYLRSVVEPGEAIFIPRSEPLLYFATGTRNPTPYGGVLPAIREEQQERILESLSEVRYVVMSDIDQPLYLYYSEALPKVQAYLERYFRPAQDYPLDDGSWIVVLERGSDRGATTIDLNAERTRSRAWLRDLSGEEVEASAEPPRLATKQNRRPLPIELGLFGGGLDLDIEVPANAVFQAGIGFRGMAALDRFLGHPKDAYMALSIGRGGVFRRLHSLKVDDSPRGGRRWTAFEVDLSEYAGQHLTLRLETFSYAAFDEGSWAWWGSPRVAVRPAPE